MTKPTETGQTASTADLPIHPSQAWFLREMLPKLLNPNQWSLQQVLQLPIGVSSDLARAAAEAAWRRHEVLRASFRLDGQTWRQHIADPSVAVPYHVLDLSGLEATQHPATLELITAQALGALNVTTGPLVRFVYVAAGAEARPQLVVVMHHLVCDNYSMWLLIQELEAWITYSHAGKRPPAMQGAPYRECVQALHDCASSPLLLDEFAYWTAQPWDEVVDPPGVPPDDGPEVLRPWTSVTAVVEGQDASTILRSPASHGMSLERVALAVVTDVITDWAGGAICVRLLSHGRDLALTTGGPALFPPGVQGTVGWFAIGMLAILPPRGGLDRESYLRGVAERTAAALDRGVGINLLHYPAPPGPHSAAVEQMWAHTALLYNYVGDVNGSLTVGVKEPPPFRSGGMLHAPSRFPLNVLVAVTDTELFVNLDHDPGILSSDAVIRLAASIQDAFSEYARTLRDSPATTGAADVTVAPGVVSVASSDRAG